MTKMFNVKPQGNNAVIYTRVSSKGQLEGGGLQSQERACRDYCDRKGYKVIEVFQDSFTGGEISRPGINALMDFLDKQIKLGNAISQFVVDDVDRIARDIAVHLQIKQELLKRGISYKTVKIEFEESSIGKLMEGFMALNAQFFKDHNQERVISRSQARLLDGYRPRPVHKGYTFAKAPGGGKVLVKDEPRASIITNGLNLFAEGVLLTGGDFHIYINQNGYKCNKANSYKILKNIINSGYIEYQNTSYDKKTGLIKFERDIEKRLGKHEGLITPETYEKILERLGENRVNHSEIQQINAEYPLRGYVICECCKKRFSSGRSRSKSGEQIPYYQFNKQCVHKQKSIQSNKLHQEFENILEGLSISDEYLNFMKTILIQQFNEKTKSNKLSIDAIEEEIKKIDKEINDTIESISKVKSSMVIESLEKKTNELQNSKIRLLNTITDLQKSGIIEKTMNLAFEILANPLYVWKHGTLEQKHILLDLIFKEKIPVDFRTKSFGTLEYSSIYKAFQVIGDIKYPKLDSRRVELLTSSVQTRRSTS